MTGYRQIYNERIFVLTTEKYVKHFKPWLNSAVFSSYFHLVDNLDFLSASDMFLI